jgi:hypothetical protein
LAADWGCGAESCGRGGVEVSESVSKPQGWTGKKCPACGGCGQQYIEAVDCDGPCPKCGGTGDEYGDIEVADVGEWR